MATDLCMGNVDILPGGEDILLHPRMTTAFQVTKVDTSLQEALKRVIDPTKIKRLKITCTALEHEGALRPLGPLLRLPYCFILTLFTSTLEFVPPWILHGTHTLHYTN